MRHVDAGGVACGADWTAPHSDASTSIDIRWLRGDSHCTSSRGISSKKRETTL